jgi:hypothetical protein
MFWLRNRRPQDWRDKVEHEHRDAPRSVAEVDATGKRARIVALAASADDAPAHDDAGSPPPGWANASSLRRSFIFWTVRWA